MRPTTRMIWLFVILILGSALYFVFLDDEDTAGNSNPLSAPVTTRAPAK